MEIQTLKDLPPVGELGFGRHYAPLMAISDYKDSKWGPVKLGPLKTLDVHPGARCLHYAQEIFEGLKAYKNSKTGKVHLWRPNFNIRRMSRSAEIMIMPPFPEDVFLNSMRDLVAQSLKFVPDSPGALYLRPTCVGVSSSLGVAPAQEYSFYILASPVGGYFGGVKADEPSSIRLWVSPEKVRAAHGGVGSAKTGANYASSLPALSYAKSKGFENVLFLDAVDKKNIEELSGMNFFVVEDGILKTSPLGDTILQGCTRDTILTLGSKLDIPTREEKLPIDRIAQGIRSGSVTEAFACGTGASITAVGELNWKDEKLTIAGGKPGKFTRKLYTQLIGEQFGLLPPTDPSWIVPC